MREYQVILPYPSRVVDDKFEYILADEVIDWLDQLCGLDDWSWYVNDRVDAWGDHEITNYEFTFDNEHHALLFKLTWGGQ